MRRRADSSAAGAADFLSRRSRSELLSRLELVTVKPRLILDAGAAVGEASGELGRRFRRARVVSLDLSTRRLAVARSSRRRFSRRHEVAGDAARLPFRDGTFDMAFSNLLLPYFADVGPVVGELARVLRPEALFTFASLGPDSFREIREAWQEVDLAPRVPDFLDMHDLGDALVRAGFRDPVLDIEHITVTYDDPDACWRDLSAAGARNMLAGRRRGLSTPDLFRRFSAAWRERQLEDGRLPLSIELVYGHCWGGSRLRGPDERGEIRIRPEQILGRN